MVQNRIDDDALLPRDKTAEALSERGFPTSPKTLATKATRGGGPPYALFGKRALYRWGDVVAWAQSRLSPPADTTSEHRASHLSAPQKSTSDARAA